MALALPLAVTSPGTSYAQSTVVVGGSGKSSVEVNLDILEPSSESVTPYGRVLKMPGMGAEKPFTLKMPGTSGARAKTTLPRLKLKSPSKSRLSIAKKAPALPPARVTAAPAPKAMQVAPPPQKAMPVAKPAAPAVPKDIARPTTKPAPVAKPVRTVRQTPAVTPPPPAPKKVAPPPPPAVVKPAPAPVVPAAPKAVPSPAPKKQKVASLPPKAMINTPGLALRVNFSGNSTRISAQEKLHLDGFAEKITASGDRLQLKSFAGASGETASASRRRSLSRALAVRSYLIEKGVRSTRIDVRALGMAADSGPTDRVDVIILVR